MSDWIGLGVILLIVACGLFGLARLGAPPESITQEEYEKRIAEGRGTLGASVIGLQNILEPGAKKAFEVQEDYRQGYYEGEQETGDKPEAGPTARD